ncbi:MAG: diaminopimelate decarboxylase [Deltaproteobacteria bacterium]|nr:diaminopimelate decarboxylase [Deltaproteobacteria bacterium]
MNFFHEQDGQLFCEEVPVERIARDTGTPFYLYSHRTLQHHFRVFDEAFAEVPHIVCFAVKANSNTAILRLFIREGGGVDLVSGGELFRALKAGVDPGKVVYSGVGKRDDEIDYALASGILMFNVESAQELETINERAAQIGVRAGIALRVNPDVDPQTHPHISTGLKENKFGIDVENSLAAYRRASALKHLDIKGVSCHIGSQVTKISPFTDALARLKDLIGRLRQEGIAIRYLDLGGGLGITYDQEEPPQPAQYARAVIDAVKELECTFILEPGRVLVGNAGILVTQVLYTKGNEGKRFVIVDAGMNDLVRPSLYGSFHRIVPVIRRERPEATVDVVGPICESGDFLAKGRLLPAFERGELMAVMSAGAYGFTMSSNYNSRPRIPEILVRDDRWYVIRQRETCEDLIRGEEIPDFMTT